MDRTRRQPPFRRSAAADADRSSNRARATADPVPSRIQPLPVRAPVLPVNIGPLPEQAEPSEELALKTAWLESAEDPVSLPEDPATEDAETEEVTRILAFPAPVRARRVRARRPRRSPQSWLGGSLLGMVAAAALVLGGAWYFAG